MISRAQGYSWERNEVLLEEYHRTGDLALRNQVVVNNQGLVRKIARGYNSDDLDFKDLVSEGTIGLINATEKFDLNKGYKFSSYAPWHIRQSISNVIRKKSLHSEISMDYVVGLDGEGRNLHEILPDKKTPGYEEKERLREESKEMSRRIFENTPLTEMERRLIHMRYFINKSYSEVSKELGIKIERAKQIEGRALRRMRRSNPDYGL